MKILVIGGTVFLGKHIIIKLLNRNHEVTIFNRGKSSIRSDKKNQAIVDRCELIIGDRNNAKDIATLQNRNFDIVIDTCGYYPRQLRESNKVLEKNVGLYIYISSVSVYKDFEKIGIDEDYEVGKLNDETSEVMNGETYGPLKALCEKEVLESFGIEKSLIIRPGYIVGPDDPTDRFTYWPYKISLGNRMIIPKDTELFDMQILDVRDLSEWIVMMIENDENGTYNAIGPDYKLTFKEIIDKSNIFFKNFIRFS